MSKVIALIPARFQSSRYPGKPLVSLLGKPMILWVCEVTAQAVGAENTYVATDSEAIAEVVRAAGFQVAMTSSDCLTGTDRVAEAVANLEADIIVNVQGDEPMLAPESIQRVIEAKQKLPGWIVNGMAAVSADEDPTSRNMPKVVVNESNRLLYMSRALLPSSKNEAVRPEPTWKQVCIYAFEPQHLRQFIEFGRKSFNESLEDIEILRFLELDVPIQMLELEASSLAVDCPEDVEKVERALQARAEAGVQ